ncbi:MAG: hypothetical protein CK426_06110 [Legionella sp.]|nr:MAG: hypothetical protein CK423_02330 [Legionella sp.]PJD98468.1 MAG: hypothetical protein CK426_06110 [Legionella sp.]
MSGYTVVEHDSDSIERSLNDQQSFPDLILNWQSKWDTATQLKISEKNWLRLIQLFNEFVCLLARKSQENNLWGKELADSKNIFTPHAVPHGDEINGHAFVPQCKESTIFQRLFLLNHEGNSERLTVYENATAAYRRFHPQSNWALLDNMLTHALGFLAQLKLSLKEPVDLDNRLTVEQVIPYLGEFSRCWGEVKDRVLAEQATLPEKTISSFYEISETDLHQLSAHQLTCVVLEESNHESPSLLLLRIIAQQALWVKVQQAFQKGTYLHRSDQASDKMRWLQWLHRIYDETLIGQALKQQIGFNSQLMSENAFIEEINKQQKEEIQLLEKAKSEACQLLEQEKMNTEEIMGTLNTIQERCNKLKKRNQDTEARLGAFVDKCNALESEKNKAMGQSKQYASIATQTPQEVDAPPAVGSQLDENLEKNKAIGQSKQYASIATQTSQEVSPSAVKPQSASIGVQTPNLQSKDLAAVAREKQRLEELASVVHYIKLIKTKAENLKERDHQAAYKAAEKLITDLDKEIKHYLAYNQSLPEFKKRCQTHIKKAGEELKQWRGWEGVLWRTLHCILNLGCMITNGIGYTENKEVTLFKPTKSAELLEKLNNEISRMP